MSGLRFGCQGETQSRLVVGTGYVPALVCDMKKARYLQQGTVPRQMRGHGGHGFVLAPYNRRGIHT